MATKTAARRGSSRRAHGKPLGQRARGLYGLWAGLFAKHELMTCATGIAFKTLTAAISLMLLGLGVLGALGRQDVWVNQIAPHIRGRVLSDVYAGINQTVDTIFSHNTAGLIAFGSLFAVWQFSGAVRAAMDGLSHIYEEEDTRPFWGRFLISLGLAVPIIAALLAAILLVMAAGGAVGGALQVPWAIFRWLAAIVLVGLAFGLLVRYGPQKRRAKRWTSVGAGLVVVGWLVEALAFRWWLSSVADFKTAVGSLTIVLFVTAYFYVAAIILLVAIELDELIRRGVDEEAGGLLRFVRGLF